MAKYRSKTNYAQIYSGDKKGYNLGLDAQIFLKREITPRLFNPPSVGTSGKSMSAVSASTDISAGTDNAFKIAVSGGVVVDVVLTQAGKTTGLLIAAEMELKINAALIAAGQDAQVWVNFNGAGPDQYTIWNQFTGLAATVVVTNASVNNIADQLKIGLANTGTESAGTDDTDFLLYTTGGINFNQPVESNMHRSGRFHTGIIRKKKVCEFDFDTYVNMSGAADASIDNAVQLLIESMMGKKTVNTGSDITFEQDLPVIFMSVAKISTIFGEYYTGGYVRQMNFSFPGDGPAKVKYQGKAADCSVAGIGKLSLAMSATATATLVTGESEHFTAGAYVMAVDADGRTILAGHDGSIKVVSYDDTLGTILLDTAITVPINGFIVPWNPGAVQATGRDAIFTDLVGSMKLNVADGVVDVTDIQLTMNNDHVDLDNRYGSDTNKGFVAGNRMTPELSVTFDLSNETFGKVIRSRSFAGFAPEIVLGAVGSGRYMKITAPKWIPSVPNLELPENGVTPITLVGNLFQSAPNAKDPIKVKFG